MENPWHESRQSLPEIVLIVRIYYISPSDSSIMEEVTISTEYNCGTRTKGILRIHDTFCATGLSKYDPIILV